MGLGDLILGYLGSLKRETQTKHVKRKIDRRKKNSKNEGFVGLT